MLSHRISTLGIATIVSSWTLTCIAIVLVSAVAWARNDYPRIDDYTIYMAIIVTIVLVAQITWAIVDEAQDSHVIEVSRTQFALVARVS